LQPDDKWGETPAAFVTLKSRAQHGGETPTTDELLEYCRANMASFKCPRHVVFTNLPKTSTGKIQKFELRQATAEL
jgi:fatty-acyl-CoA synthase